MAVRSDRRAWARVALSFVGGSSGLTFACASEIALFAVGAKPALRFVVPPATGEALARHGAETGHAVEVWHVSVQPRGHGWSDLLPATQGETGEAVMVVVADDGHLAARIAEAETGGASAEVGHLLGYPTCCVAMSEELGRAGARWAAALTERSGAGPFSAWANRLATGWGGLCAIGELFPCTLGCPRASAQGYRAWRALQELGLDRLAAALVQHAMTSVWVGEDGAVARREEALGPRARRVDFQCEPPEGMCARSTNMW